MSYNEPFKGYITLHSWVRYHKGKPNLCEKCGATEAKKFEWANISGEYKRDLSDWIRLCVSCHRFMDYEKTCRRGHLRNQQNTLIMSNGKRRCLICRRQVRKEYRKRPEVIEYQKKYHREYMKTYRKVLS